jgi:hypothetical protein
MCDTNIDDDDERVISRCCQKPYCLECLHSLIDHYFRDCGYSCKSNNGINKYYVRINDIQCNGCGHESPIFRVDREIYKNIVSKQVPNFLKMSSIKFQYKRAQKIRQKIRKETKRQEAIDTAELDNRILKRPRTIMY